MMTSKLIVVLLILCSVDRFQCTPIPNDITEGRGIGSTLWGWITYPFSWWSSGSTDIPPETDSTGPAPQDIEVATHNVTVWCNDQTCTTRRCDKFGCANVTCNIYDTDLNGECRHYNTVKPEEPVAVPEEPVVVPEEPVIVPEDTTVATEVHVKSQLPVTDEDRPLELETVLSSTVTKVDNDTKH